MNPHRTIGQSVMESLPGHSRSSLKADRTRASEMLIRVGLDASSFDRFPGQFSGGQRQRIAIARALLPSPQLIVCDEVVSALDLSVQAQVINLLLELQLDRSLSYMFITHDLSVVRHLCQRVVVLRKGRVVETGLTDAVMTNPQDPYTQRLILASPVVDPLEQKERRLERQKLVH
jgi:ABC-type oligopeptide transport system ATPase subunit